MLAWLLENYPSGGFSFVMATGIVSIGAALLGHRGIAAILLAINVIGFTLLWALTLIRLVYHPRSFLADAADFRRGPGLLTIVAGTSVLGEQISLLTPYRDIAAIMWLGASVIWAGLTYFVFAQVTIGASKPRLRSGLDGNWLLAVVAAEALAILGTQVASVFAVPETALFASMCLFSLGGVFYFIIITLILYRWLFVPMMPEDLTPSYWINMGAAAITALAGAQLALSVGGYPVLANWRDFIIGQAVVFWRR